MIDEPRESAANREGRDELGRFLPGCPPGPGRPPVPDFRRAVAERLAANGGSVDAVLFELFEALRAEAVAGNVAAAKLLLDRLAPAEDKAGRDRGPTLEEVIAATVDRREHEAGVRTLLGSAAFRAELDRQRPVLQVETGIPPADDEGERSR